MVNIGSKIAFTATHFFQNLCSVFAWGMGLCHFDAVYLFRYKTLVRIGYDSTRTCNYIGIARFPNPYITDGVISEGTLYSCQENSHDLRIVPSNGCGKYHPLEVLLERSLGVPILGRVTWYTRVEIGDGLGKKDHEWRCVALGLGL